MTRPAPHHPNAPGTPLLIACAVHAEAKAVAKGLGYGGALPDEFWRAFLVREDVRLVVTGVGKANAAGAVAHALAHESTIAVWNLGVAGTLDADKLGIGQAVLGSSSVFADEGVSTPAGFTPMSGLGFPICAGVDDPVTSRGESLPITATVLDSITTCAHANGIIATVSTGSGTDARTADVRQRTGAIAEAMEGAAIALTCARLDVPFLELRAISNTTGNRDAQTWNLHAALETLETIARAI